MYIKVLSNDPRNRIYLTECDTVTRERHTIASSDELKELLVSMQRSYTTPIVVRPLEQGWDWDDKARLLVLYVQRDSGHEIPNVERLLLWNATVFFMNDAGSTIDTTRV